MAAVQLKDVAALAQVSVRTVSNVVANHPNVRASTRERVLAAIDSLGYVPNESARRLARGRSGTIAFAISSIEVPYFAELAHLLIEAALARGYRVLIEQTAADPERERHSIDRRESGLVDGVVLMTAALSSAEITQGRGRVPLVLLGEAAAAVDTDHVTVDNEVAAREATTQMIRGGAGRLAFLGAGHDDRSRWIGRGRLAGWQRAQEEHGMPIDAARVLVTQDWSFADGYAAVDAALRDGIRFDGIFCCEDKLALGALAALAAHGRRVPDDVAVTGWDDIAAAAYAVPALTSVAPDKTALVTTALDLLIARIEGDTDPARHLTAPHGLAVRASTRTLTS